MLYNEHGFGAQRTVELRDLALEIVMTATGLRGAAATHSPAFRYLLDSLMGGAHAHEFHASECTDPEQATVSVDTAHALTRRWQDHWPRLLEMATGRSAAEAISDGAHAAEKVQELRKYLSTSGEEHESVERALAAFLACLAGAISRQDMQVIAQVAVQRYGSHLHSMTSEVLFDLIWSLPISYFGGGAGDAEQ